MAALRFAAPGSGATGRTGSTVREVGAFAGVTASLAVVVGCGGVAAAPVELIIVCSGWSIGDAALIVGTIIGLATVAVGDAGAGAEAGVDAGEFIIGEAAVIMGLVAIDCVAGAGAAVVPAGRVIGDEDAGGTVRDDGLTMVAVATLDPDGGGGAPPFSLTGLTPPARACCPETVP